MSRLADESEGPTPRPGRQLAGRLATTAFVIGAAIAAFMPSPTSAQTTSTSVAPTTTTDVGSVLVSCGSPIPQQLECTAIVVPADVDSQTFRWSVDGEAVEGQSGPNLLIYSLPAGSHRVEAVAVGRNIEPGRVVTDLAAPEPAEGSSTDFPWGKLAAVVASTTIILIARLRQIRARNRSDH